MANKLEAAVRVLVERCDHPAYNGATKGEFYPDSAIIVIDDLFQFLFARDLLEDYRAVKRLSVCCHMAFDKDDATAVHKAIEHAINRELDCAQVFGPDTLIFKWV